MGQPLPLPERIPHPSDAVYTRMKEVGISADVDSSERYISYTLPTGWKMVDASRRQDLPIYYIVDASDMIFFEINGAWKGTYDNELYICAKKEICKFERRQNLMERSKTDFPGLATQIAVTVDPRHTPAPSHCGHVADYTQN